MWISPYNLRTSDASAAKWWLHLLGGRWQRAQLFGTTTFVCLVVAVVADAARLSIDEAERRFCDLGGRGRSCSQCMILVSCSGSCSRQPEAFRTFGSCILA